MMFLAALLGAMTLGTLVSVQDDDDVFDGADQAPEDDGLERIGDTGISSTDVPDDLLSYAETPEDLPQESLTSYSAAQSDANTDDTAMVGDAGFAETHTEGTDASDILSGGEGQDTLIGGHGADQMNGYDDDDTLRGGTGGDYMFGGDGADNLHGDAGHDSIQGDSGNDLIEGASGDDTAFGGEGDDTLDGGAGADSLLGGDGDDIASAGTGDDAVHGGSGNDTIRGGAGEDTLFGGHGDDLVRGDDDSDADHLNGGSGDDVLQAGEGDILTGGLGADTMLFGDWTNDSAAIEITDFEQGVDTLVLAYDDYMGEEPVLSIQPLPNDASVVEVQIDDVTAALVHNAPDLTADDIALVAQSSLQSAA